MCYARYGGDYTMASLRLFVASKTGLSITMEGCIKWVVQCLLLIQTILNETKPNARDASLLLATICSSSKPNYAKHYKTD